MRFSSYPFGWGLAYYFPDSDGVCSSGALCQCPCSGDHTLPGGAGPGGSEIGSVGNWELRGVESGVDVTGASCQCPCSGDHTLPGGAGPGGSEVDSADGVDDWGTKGVDTGVDCGVDVTGASCQCPCSGDHTFPGGGLS